MIRLQLIGLFVSSVFLYGFTPSVTAEPLWQYFKDQFISDDGRVIDTQQQQISHSEGQGYGMLLAVKFNDQATFKKLWRWSQDNLQIRKDRLFAWKFGRHESGQWKGNKSTYEIGDVFRVERIGNTIHYKKNGTTFYVSTKKSSGSLLGDISMYHTGAKFKDFFGVSVMVLK